jgi:hypothetical protein
VILFGQLYHAIRVPPEISRTAPDRWPPQTKYFGRKAYAGPKFGMGPLSLDIRA